MELRTYSEKIIHFLKKYRYAALVLAIGLVLIAIPTAHTEDAKTENVTQEQQIEEISTEEQLSALLSKIDGAGKVEVMLTVAQGEQILYQQNSDQDTDENSSSISMDTVTVTDADKNQSGLVRQVNPPVYQGAVIVCQGGDDPKVKLAIVDAVSKITGLGVNCISVLKMK